MNDQVKVSSTHVLALMIAAGGFLTGCACLIGMGLMPKLF
jgi:hypothetical protein